MLGNVVLVIISVGAKKSSILVNGIVSKQESWRDLFFGNELRMKKVVQWSMELRS